MPIWILGLGIAGLRAAAHLLCLLHHHQLLGPIRAVRVGAGDVAPVRPEIAEAVQASQVVTVLTTRTTTTSLLLTVRIPSLLVGLQEPSQDHCAVAP